MSASHSEPMGARGWEPDFGRTADALIAEWDRWEASRYKDGDPWQSLENAGVTVSQSHGRFTTYFLAQYKGREVRAEHFGGLWDFNARRWFCQCVSLLEEGA